MSQQQSETRADYFSYATHSVFAAADDDHSREALETLQDLIREFGDDVVLGAIQQTTIANKIGVTEERVSQALRALAIILTESRWPKLDAILVGRLVQMELATGHRMKMDDLGRQFGGQSKQAISKRQGELAQRLNLPNPDSTEEARQSHRLMNRSNRNL